MPLALTSTSMSTTSAADQMLDVERSAIKRLLADYLARVSEFAPGSWADGHISGAIEALERVLAMEDE